MRWILACTLVVALGCGDEAQQEPGSTFVSVGPVEDVGGLRYEVICGDTPEPEDDFSLDGACDVLDTAPDVCMLAMDLPAGSCTMLIRLFDSGTGEPICVQEEEFVVALEGETELNIVLDNCSPVTIPSRP